MLGHWQWHSNTTQQAVTASGMTQTKPARPDQRTASLAALGALGVVYGDIGTSPLYALREAAKAAAAGGALSSSGAIAATSAILWALIIVVALKYALLILRADNHGEGGIMAMMALLHARGERKGGHGAILLVTGLVGAALLYGDGAITPAVSVLSAIEGLKSDAPRLAPAVIPLTVIILGALFWAQRKGTGVIGRVFGPVMLLWFFAIAVIGGLSIAKTPEVLAALNPLSAIGFFAHAPLAVAVAVLGAAFLAVTGGEAMYADLGHFGARAIRAAWFVIVLPALMLNYLGQGALLLRTPSAVSDPFYQLTPTWAHYPMVAFATAATIIASQAIISGAFSLTAQAIQMGYLPHLLIRHTDKAEAGQVYLPLVNALLAVGTLAAVLVFRSSDALAGAYGIAVSALMVITTVLATLVARQWNYSWWTILPINGLFLLVDTAFFGANSVKLLEGGWFPLVIAGIIAVVMLTWRRGSELVEQHRVALRPTEPDFIRGLAGVTRSPLCAAFLSSATEGIPLPLARVRDLTNSVPHRILLVSVLTTDEPVVPDGLRADVVPVGAGIQRVTLRYGFAEGIDVPAGLAQHASELPGVDLDNLIYYLGRESFLPDPDVPGMAGWREGMFAFMARNAERTAEYFCVPPSRVIEIGTEFAI
jgi:KUP system potassium uptake protein